MASSPERINELEKTENIKKFYIITYPGRNYLKVYDCQK